MRPSRAVQKATDDQVVSVGLPSFTVLGRKEPEDCLGDCRWEREIDAAFAIGFALVYRAPDLDLVLGIGARLAELVLQDELQSEWHFFSPELVYVVRRQIHGLLR
jgi:hypothetical protein